MSDLNLGPSKSPSSAPGFLIAAALLIGIAGFMAYRYTHRVAHLSIPNAKLFPIHTEFGAHMAVAAGTPIETRREVEDDIYVLVTVHVQNDNTVPVFLKSYKTKLTNAEGAELEGSAIVKSDIPSVLQTFPAMKPLVTTPLDLDNTIAPGASAEGMVLLQFPTTKDVWDKRKSAVLTVGFYHQDPVMLTIPATQE